jgi:hypothetical protein
MTLWAYLRHPQATRGRVLTVLALRLLALLIGLLTAIRPSLGVQEDPKLPSTLLVGIDLSETMSVADEVNSRTRIEAARAALEKCQPTIDELLAEQNVTVKFYAFGPGDFTEATNQYDPQAPASAKKSDYGRYLTATRERWRTERFVRGHLLIGDGADNGTSVNALTEAGQWRSIAAHRRGRAHGKPVERPRCLRRGDCLRAGTGADQDRSDGEGGHQSSRLRRSDRAGRAVHRRGRRVCRKEDREGEARQRNRQ